MRFYDAHIHFLFQCTSSKLRRIFDFLEGIGLAGFDAIVIAEYPNEIKKILKMVPEEYHDLVSLEVLANQRDTLPLFNQTTHLEIMPYLDARFIETNIEQKIKIYREMGFRGLKLLYIPEEDTVLRTSGMQQAFGRTLKQSEKITSMLIESASNQGMSVLLHVDLRKYGNFVSDMIKGYPETNFNIAHFGFSRRAISPLLENNSNCYTDMSSLTAFMKKDMVSYLNFIRYNRNRILFGSDAFIDKPENVQNTLQFVISYLDDPELVQNIVKQNYLKFHKRLAKFE